MVTKHTMRDFIGLENADEEAKKAMMNFSYLSAIGNMDEAFKAIKLIKRYVIITLREIQNSPLEVTRRLYSPVYFATGQINPPPAVQINPPSLRLTPPPRRSD